MEDTKKLCYLFAALFVFIGALALDGNLTPTYHRGQMFNDLQYIYQNVSALKLLVQGLL